MLNASAGCVEFRHVALIATGCPKKPNLEKKIFLTKREHLVTKKGTCATSELPRLTEANAGRLQNARATGFIQKGGLDRYGNQRESCAFGGPGSAGGGGKNSTEVLLSSEGGGETGENHSDQGVDEGVSVSWTRPRFHGINGLKFLSLFKRTPLKLNKPLRAGTIQAHKTIHVEQAGGASAQAEGNERLRHHGVVPGRGRQ